MKECPNCKGYTADCEVCDGTGEVFDDKDIMEEVEAFKKRFEDAMNPEGKTIEERVANIEACLVEFMKHQTLHCSQIHANTDLIRILGLYIGIAGIEDLTKEARAHGEARKN